MPAEKILVPHRDLIHVIDYSSILFFKSDNYYTHIFLVDGRQLVLIKSLAKVEKDIQSDQFIRISQSFLVNSHFIREINKKQKKVHLDGTHILPFTISFKKLGELLAS